MQTVKIELEDKLYKSIVASGINIQERLQEMLYDLVDDGYPSIATKEAEKKVSDAVDRYKNGTGEYLDHSEYLKEMEQFSTNL